MAILLLVGVMLAAAAVGFYGYAEDREEELLFLKLMGYGFLGFFTFNINRFPLPIGFALALWMASNAQVNRKARQAAAIVTFVLFLIGLVF